MPIVGPRGRRSAAASWRVDEGGRDGGQMPGGTAELVPAAVRALEVAVGLVLSGGADGAVRLNHLARSPGERLRAVDLDGGGAQAEVWVAGGIGRHRA